MPKPSSNQTIARKCRISPKLAQRLKLGVEFREGSGSFGSRKARGNYTKSGAIHTSGEMDLVFSESEAKAFGVKLTFLELLRQGGKVFPS